jgi:hypothetical protein
LLLPWINAQAVPTFYVTDFYLFFSFVYVEDVANATGLQAFFVINQTKILNENEATLPCSVW